MTPTQLKMHLLMPVPARKSVGYWAGATGVVVTAFMILGAVFNPSILKSRLWGLPPSLILAGLAVEAIEAVQRRRQQPTPNDAQEVI
jgi:hypothetical protein